MSALPAESWALEPEIMEVDGRFDGGTAAFVEEDAQLCIQSGAKTLILDCERVTYMSSAGLRTMLVLAKAMQERGGKLAVCNIEGQPFEMFAACNMAAVIPAYATRGEASAALAA